MDHPKVLLVPFHPTLLLMAGVFSVVMTFFIWGASFLGAAGFWSLVVVFILNTWVLKYGFVLLEQIADGAPEPPVMDSDMLSPLETRPLLQAMLLLGGATLCWKLGGTPGVALAGLLLLAFPAQVAQLGMGDHVIRAMNPLAWLRVVRGLGPYYLLLLGSLVLIVGVNYLIARADLWTPAQIFILLLSETLFFGLVGASIWLRRKPLGFEPSRSPERTAAKAERERLQRRAAMIDEVFQQVRIGKHVDSTAPLARWMADLEPEEAVRDALHMAEQALRWQLPAALNPIGSTLIRHLLRFGRADAALAVFTQFRERSPRFTMDSAADLRVLAEYADSVGQEALAQSMRLETPIVQPAR